MVEFRENPDLTAMGDVDFDDFRKSCYSRSTGCVIFIDLLKTLLDLGIASVDAPIVL